MSYFYDHKEKNTTGDYSNDSSYSDKEDKTSRTSPRQEFKDFMVPSRPHGNPYPRIIDHSNVATLVFDPNRSYSNPYPRVVDSSNGATPAFNPARFPKITERTNDSASQEEPIAKAKAAPKPNTRDVAKHKYRPLDPQYLKYESAPYESDDEPRPERNPSKSAIPVRRGFSRSAKPSSDEPLFEPKSEETTPIYFDGITDELRRIGEINPLKVNPEERNELYHSIYRKEKEYRNLQGYEHCFLITDDMFEQIRKYNDVNIFRSNIQDLLEQYEGIPIQYRKNFIIAGGAVVDAIYTSKPKDIDFFAVESDDFSVNEFKRVIGNVFSDRFFDCLSFKNSIASKISNKTFIKRLYKSPSQVVHGFDLDACCIYITHEGNVYATERCLFSWITGGNTVNFDRMSSSYERRLCKYETLKGFEIFTPPEYDDHLLVDEKFNFGAGAIMISRITGKLPKGTSDYEIGDVCTISTTVERSKYDEPVDSNLCSHLLRQYIPIHKSEAVNRVTLLILEFVDSNKVVTWGMLYDFLKDQEERSDDLYLLIDMIQEIKFICYEVPDLSYLLTIETQNPDQQAMGSFHRLVYNNPMEWYPPKIPESRELTEFTKSCEQYFRYSTKRDKLYHNDAFYTSFFDDNMVRVPLKEFREMIDVEPMVDPRIARVSYYPSKPFNRDCIEPVLKTGKVILVGGGALSFIYNRYMTYGLNFLPNDSDLSYNEINELESDAKNVIQTLFYLNLTGKQWKQCDERIKEREEDGHESRFDDNVYIPGVSVTSRPTEDHPCLDVEIQFYQGEYWVTTNKFTFQMLKWKLLCFYIGKDDSFSSKKKYTFEINSDRIRHLKTIRRLCDNGFGFIWR